MRGRLLLFCFCLLGTVAEAADPADLLVLLKDHEALTQLLRDRPLRARYRDSLLALATAAANRNDDGAAKAFIAYGRFLEGPGSGRVSLLLGGDEAAATALRALVAQRHNPDLAAAALTVTMLLPRNEWRDALLEALRDPEPTEHRSALLRLALERNLARVPRTDSDARGATRLPIDGELFLALDQAALYDIRGGRGLRESMALDHERIQWLAGEREATDDERRLAVECRWFVRPSALAAQLRELVDAWRAAEGTPLEAAYEAGMRRMLANPVWRDALLDAKGAVGTSLREWYGRVAARGSLTIEDTQRLVDDERIDIEWRRRAREHLTQAFAARAREPGLGRATLLLLLGDRRLAEHDRVHVAARLRAEHPRDGAVTTAIQRAYIQGLLPDRWEKQEPLLLKAVHLRQLRNGDADERARAAECLVPLAREPEVLDVLLDHYAHDRAPAVKAALHTGLRQLLSRDRFFYSALLEDLALQEIPGERLERLAVLFLDLAPNDLYVRQLVGRVARRDTEAPRTALAQNCIARIRDLAE